MTSDDLIRRLAAEAAGNPAPAAAARFRRHLAGLTALALAGITGLVLTGYGLRGDLAATLGTGAGLMKFALAGSAGLLGFVHLRRLGLPASGGTCRWAPAGLVAAVALVVLAAAAPGTAPLPLHDALTCATTILGLALLPLAALLIGLRAGAPTRLAAAGGVAGALSGAIAIFGYALWCPSNDLRFVVCAYGAALLSVILAGVVIAPRTAAW